MAVFKVRISDETAATFDAVAAGVGGRSALLRRLVQDQAGGAQETSEAVPGQRSAARLMVRLAAREAAHVEAEANTMGLRRAGWVAALVRRHGLGRPTLDQASETSLLAIRGEIRRIGVNLNQIARAMNTAVVEGRVLALELQSIDDLRLELRGHMAAVREAFIGNLAYWETDL